MKRFVLYIFLLLSATASAQQKVQMRTPLHVKQLRLREATMDISNGIIGSDKAAQGINLPQAFDGSGVVLGVTDIGFDFTHPNFQNSNILSFWDMITTDTLSGNERMLTGRDYNADELRALQHSYDGLKQTHGTHVLGIAAGGNDVYRGVAPNADIVLVNNVLGDNYGQLDSIQQKKILNTPDYEIQEFKYIFNQAEKAGKPCVINISAGSRQSFGDDFPIFNKKISDICGPGRIIVASAGNNGQQLVTLHKRPDQESVGSRPIVTNSQLCYLFFQRKGDVECELLYANEEDGEKFLLPDTLYEAIDTISDYDASFVRYYILEHEKMEGKGQFLYARLSGTGEGFLFTQGVRYQNSGKDDGFNDAVYDYSVDFPACYDDIICVGGTDYRNDIVNYKGEEMHTDNGELGKEFIHTSVGPRLDGYQKPDVVAPASCINSSYNSFYEEYNPLARDILWDVEHFEHNGRTYAWNSNSGTSMSSPIVAGVVALWLQANPNLTPQDIKDIIKRTAKHPDPSLQYPNAIYGYGEIDAYAGLLDILGIDKIESISKEQIKDFRFSIKDKMLTISPSNGKSWDDLSTQQNTTIQIYTTGGQLVLQEKIIVDGNPQTISLQHLPKGIYAVQINKASTLIRI